MEAFFKQFQNLSLQNGIGTESNFQRLAEINGWTPTCGDYVKHRRDYLNALLVETNSPVHKFFIANHNFLTYDPTAPPKSQFESLALAKGWNPNHRAYRIAHEQFTSAYTEEFGSKLLEFFEQYEADGFFWNPRLDARKQLGALFDKLKPTKNKRKSVRDKFMEAIGDDVNRKFGKNDNDINGWQYLCEVLGVDKEPTSISACKRAVAKIYVNIFDLEEYERLRRSRVSGETPLKRFKSVRELSQHTFKYKKVYSKEKAKQGVMKFMLREITVFRNGGR